MSINFPNNLYLQKLKELDDTLVEVKMMIK